MKTRDDLIDQLLYEFKHEDKPFLDTLKRLHEIFEETCKICLGKCPKGKATCSKECTYKLRSLNSTRNVKQGKATSIYKD